MCDPSETIDEPAEAKTEDMPEQSTTETSSDAPGD
jgi:hypothetical protein